MVNKLTRCDGIREGTDVGTIVPVGGEVADWSVRNLVLDPLEQPLLGGLVLVHQVVLSLPHGHGDGVVKDEGPYQT